MAGDEPVLLLLVRGVLHVIGWVCSCLAGPTLLALLGMRPVVEHAAFEKGSNRSITHACLAPFRILFAVLAVVLLTTVWVPVATYFVVRDGQDSVVGLVIAASFAALFMQVYGVCYLRTHVKAMEELDLASFFVSCATAPLDVIALVGLVVGAASVLQLPSILHILVTACSGNQEARESFGGSIRTALMVQPLFGLLDWVVLPMWVCAFIIPWEWPMALQAFRDEDDAATALHSARLRGAVALRGLFGVFEVLALVLGSVACLLAPYRLAMLYYQLGVCLQKGLREDREWSRVLGDFAEILAHQAGSAVLDFLTAFPLLLVAVTLYRFPHTVQKSCKLREGVRGCICQQALFVLFDVVAVISTIVVCVTVYRLPSLIRHWKLAEPKWHSIEFQGEAVAQFCAFIFDLPFLVMGLLMCIVLWRAPFLIIGLTKLTSASERRELVCRHVMWTFVDLFIDLWFLLATALIMVSLVRAPSLVQALRRDYKAGDSLDDHRVRCRLRKTVCVFLLMWVLDLPILVLALCVTVTVWRAVRLVKLLMHGEKGAHDLEADFERDLDPALAPQRDTAFNFTDMFSVHRIVAREFLFWLLDILILPLMLLVIVSWRGPSLCRALTEVWHDPDQAFGEKVHLVTFLHALALGLDLPFILCGVLSMWRIPLLLRAVCKPECSTDWKYRSTAGWYFLYMLMDIPTALVLVVFHVLGLLTPWRLLYFWRAVWAYKWGDNEHSLVATHFGRQLADLPAVVLGAVAAVVAVWRAWDMVVAVYKEERAQEAYEVVVQHLFMAVADWVCGLCALVVCCTLIRLPGMVHALTKFSDRDPGYDRCTTVYLVAVYSLYLVFVDLTSIVQFLAVLVTGVRAPAMLYRIARVFKQYTGVLRPHRTRVQGTVVEATDALTAAGPGTEAYTAARRRINELRATRAFQDVGDAQPSPLVALLWVRYSWQTDMRAAADYLGVIEDNDIMRNTLENKTQLSSFPPSWSLAHDIVRQEWATTLVVWPQLLRLPLKCVGAALFLVARAIGYRFDPTYTRAKGGPVTMELMSSLYQGIWERKGPLMVLVVALWILHDVAYIPLFGNLAFLTIMTLGAPLGWGRRLVATSITNYTRFERVMTLVYIVQMFLNLAFVALQLVLFFLPMVLYRHAITLSTYAEDGDEQSFWQDWWTLPWWMWLVQGFWVLSTFIQYMALYVAVEDKFCFKTPAEEGVEAGHRKTIRFVSPLGCYVWVIRHVFQGRVWGLYKNLLGGPTAWFKTWRSGCLKNIALIVVYLAWCGWPFVAAYFVDEVWCWIIAAVISLFLVWQGYLVVEQNWQSKHAMVPQATCQSMRFEFPDPVHKPNGDLSHRSARVTFEVRNNLGFGPDGNYLSDTSSKPKRKPWPHDQMFQVEMEVEGDGIWNDLKSVYGRFAISLVKSLGFHPFKLCPKYLDPRCIKEVDWEGVINVDLRDARKKVNFQKVLTQLRNQGDSRFEMKFYYGFSKRGRYTRQGLLFSVHTRASDIWESHVTQQPIPMALAAAHQNPAFHARARGAQARAGAGAAAGGGNHGASAVEIVIDPLLPAASASARGVPARHGSSNSLTASLLDGEKPDASRSRRGLDLERSATP